PSASTSRRTARGCRCTSSSTSTSASSRWRTACATTSSATASASGPTAGSARSSGSTGSPNADHPPARCRGVFCVCGSVGRRADDLDGPVDRPVEEHLVLVDHDAARAEILDHAHAVAHDEHRHAALGELLELLGALLAERLVADREHLVDEQHVEIDVDRDRERQAHEHARRVVLDLLVDEVLDLAERDDVVEAGVDLLL